MVRFLIVVAALVLVLQFTVPQLAQALTDLAPAGDCINVGGGNAAK